MTLRDLKYLVAQCTGIPAFLNSVMRNRLLVVTYHGIYDGPRNKRLLPATFVHIDDMVDQLDFIKRKYHIITPENLQEALENKKDLPPHAALITFDDGYENFARLAFPVFQRMQIKPIVFVATEYVESGNPFWFDLAWLSLQHIKVNVIREMIKEMHLRNNTEPSDTIVSFLAALKRMKPEARDRIVHDVASYFQPNAQEELKIFRSMESDQIQNLSEAGVSFGGHTHTHTILTALSPTETEKEILLNKKLIENITRKPCVFFAYPNGGKEDFHHVHKDILKQAGYKAAFSLTQKRSSIRDDTMDISRIHVAPEDTIYSLNFRLSGTKNLFV